MKKKYLIVLLINNIFIIFIVLAFNVYRSFNNKEFQGINTLNKIYPYPVNENGETYGVDIYNTPPEIEPDLIAAYGDNGVFGYVKAKDFDDNVTNPKEINRDKSERVLLLYEKDGETIIGTFTLQ